MNRTFVECIMLGFLVLWLGSAAGCVGTENAGITNEENTSGDTDTDSDSDADGDTESITEFDSDSETGTDNIRFANLSWDANTEDDLAGYKIHYGTISGDYTEEVNIGPTDTPESPQYTVADLEYGTTYYFVVTAYDYSGNESDVSEERSKTIPTP